MSRAVTMMRNIGYSSVSVYTEFVLGLVVSIIIARTLGPSEFGIYTHLIWLCALTMQIANAGVSIGAIKFFSELLGRREFALIPPLHTFLSKVQLLKILAVLALFTVVGLLAPYLIIDVDHAVYIWFVVPAVLFKGYYVFQVGVLKGLHDFRRIAAVALVVGPINLLLAVTASSFVPTLQGFLAVYVATCSLYFFAGVVSRRRAVSDCVGDLESPGELEHELKERVSGHLKSVGVVAIMTFIIFGQSELFFLKYFAPSSDLAFFGIGFVLVRAAIAVLPGIYDNLLLSRVAKDVADADAEEDQTVLDSSRHLFFLTALICLPLAVFADDVVVVLYGPEFEPAGVVVRAFAVLAVFSSVRLATNAYLMSADQHTTLVRIISIAFVATLILDYVLISRYGLFGAVVAYVIVDLAASIAIARNAFRLLGSSPNFGKLLRVVPAAFLATMLAVGCAALIPGNYGFIPSGIICALSMLLLFVVFDCFENSDYVALRQLTLPYNSKASRFLVKLLSFRIRESDPQEEMERGE